MDLLEAYHVYLTNLENVIGTAIGKYRIRLSDPDLENPLALRIRPSRRSSSPRTLSNSIITSYSWPCLLVFVDKWLTADELGGRPDQFDIYTLINGQRIKIGNTYSRQAGKRPFQQVPGWQLGSRTYSNLDVGTIYIDSVQYWSAQVFGVG